MAVGLGSMDMPVPAIADWEWLNWKFARAVRAGDTIYARWTLTQKRAPVGDDPTAIVVWRVDVHTAAGALCAEGEVGASVLRNAGKAAIRAEEPVVAAAAQAASATSAAPRRSRRRRRPAGGDSAKSQAEPKPAAPAAVEAASASPASTTERPAGAPRRRRRRRSPGSAQARNGDAGTSGAEAPPPKAAIAAATSSPALAPAGASSANPLTRAIRRLRRP
jgi:hypothetical protein